MSGTAQGQAREAHLALFDRLYGEHQRAVHAYLLGAVGDRDVAADLLQEVFMRVWQHRDTLAGVPEERRRYWLFHVARNVRLDYYRRRTARHAHEVPLPDREGGAVPCVAGPASTMAVDTAIARLPDDLRTVLVMSALGGMDSSEIGEVLGCPPGTVRYRLHMARRLLAEELYPSPIPSPVGQRGAGSPSPHGQALREGSGPSPHGQGLGDGSGPSPHGQALREGSGPSPRGGGVGEGSGPSPHGQGLGDGSGPSPHGGGVGEGSGPSPHGQGLGDGSGPSSHGQALREGSGPSPHGGGVGEGSRVRQERTHA